MRIHRVCQSLKLAFWNQAILNLMRYVSTLGQETPTIVSLHCSNKWPLASGGIALKIISTEVWARCNSILHSTSSIYKLYIYWSNHNSNNHGIISTTLATCIREDKETNETRRKHLTCINLYVPSGSFWILLARLLILPKFCAVHPSIVRHQLIARFSSSASPRWQLLIGGPGECAGVSWHSRHLG